MFRFSMRELMLVTLVVAVSCGRWTVPVRELRTDWGGNSLVRLVLEVIFAPQLPSFTKVSGFGVVAAHA